ncbi:glycosyltransferase family 2 protein [Cellulomonas marina]|uniref:Glycosyl transferase family 2 n=1 Tax=Cellulomonas marina TaxID=988821 RepID=A0A1I0UYP3_9CELL|nr:glycosyltransferase family 2 protein [Cellulomonas marina]GIG29932.1 glycosyl transferase [Cellulomonas marina]SFA69013.1 Glycosyl transferase family 2 [Cellulomonas marina]
MDTHDGTVRREPPGGWPCERCAGASVLLVVPCHDEAATIGGVIAGFRAVLPDIEVLVGDNLSTDGTGDVARGAGATVVHVPIKGKGRVVRRLLEYSNHDVTIMVDGDATYDPAAAVQLVHEVYCRGYDLVNVSRASKAEGDEYRSGHEWGNAALTGLQRALTGIGLRDILTGYKGMSRRFTASMPVRSQAFQVEVEIAAHAVALDLAYAEIPAPYGARPEGSVSKLSTYADGWAILRAILRLWRDHRPLQAFGLMSVPWLVAAAVLVGVAIAGFVETGEVERFPSLIAGVASFIVGMLLLTVGWILTRTQTLRRDELALAAANAIRDGVYRRHVRTHRTGPDREQERAEAILDRQIDASVPGA